MGRIHSHLATAAAVLQKYQGTQPLAAHLKQTFAADKKYGSRDRKVITGLCYAYFRSGKAFSNASVEEKILLGLFLTEHTSNEFLETLKPEWNAAISDPFEQKLARLKISLGEYYPYAAHISDQLDKNKFIHSHTNQPALFIRIRPGMHGIVSQKLTEAKIEYNWAGEDCIMLPQATKAATVLDINREVVIQDLNSQKVFEGVRNDVGISVPKTWDCCAASGGKAILLHDIYRGNFRLTVSDIRSSILENLKVRLAEADVRIEDCLVADLTKEDAPVTDQDLIICDAPCSGSGTWSRTPEQLYYFHKKKIQEYSALQQLIISNSVNGLKPGGIYVYVTCSVFKEENEQQTAFIETKGLQLLRAHYLPGYEQHADTMYVSIFRK